jgi:hypothetical protein
MIAPRLCGGKRLAIQTGSVARHGAQLCLRHALLSKLPDGFGNRILEFAGIVLADLPASTNFICHRKPPLSKAKLLLRVPRPGNGHQCHAPAPYQTTLNLLK